MKQWVIIAAWFFTTAAVEAEVKVLAFSGSTRAGSYNQTLAAEAARIAREMGASATVIDLKDYPLPFYDADVEKSKGLPSKAKELRGLIQKNDVIIIASPEYNRSISGILKNAIDWISRNEEGHFSRDAFQGKRVVLLSTSPGARGGIHGLSHLQDIIEEVGGTVVSNPLALPRARDAFDAQGRLKDAGARKSLNQLVKKSMSS